MKPDIRVKTTHLRLFRAFTELFSEQCFEEITVGKLCDRAGVHRTSFYNHYTDLYQFLYSYLSCHQSQFELFARQRAGDGSAADYLLALADEMISFLDAHRPLVESALDSQVMPRIFEMLTELIRESALSRLLEDAEPTQSMELAATFYAGGLIRLTRTWLTQPEGQTKAELLRELEIILRHSTGTAENSAL